MQAICKLYASYMQAICKLYASYMQAMQVDLTQSGHSLNTTEI